MKAGLKDGKENIAGLTNEMFDSILYVQKEARNKVRSLHSWITIK